MPGSNGTGPRGEGPMTGRGMGYCVLKWDSADPSQVEGFAGLPGKPVSFSMEDRKEDTNMPGGDGTVPAGMGPMRGRAAGYRAGYLVPGYTNTNLGRAKMEYGWPVSYGPAGYLPVPDAPRTAASYAGYPRTVWRWGRSRGRGWGRGRRF